MTLAWVLKKQQTACHETDGDPDRCISYWSSSAKKTASSWTLTSHRVTRTHAHTHTHTRTHARTHTHIHTCTHTSYAKQTQSNTSFTPYIHEAQSQFQCLSVTPQFACVVPLWALRRKEYTAVFMVQIMPAGVSKAHWPTDTPLENKRYTPGWTELRTPSVYTEEVCMSYTCL